MFSDADYFFLEPGCEIASITKDVNLNLIPEELHEEIDDETQNFTSAEDEFFESLTLDRESDSLESERNCDEEIAEEIVDEVEFEAKAVLPLTSRKNYEEEQNKLLLILLPQEQNSSCESIIGEDILEDEDPKLRDKELFADGEKVSKPKIARPKSASTFKPKKNCNISNITPNSNRLPDFGRKTWQSSRKYATKAKNKLEKNKKKNDAGLESRTSPSEGFLKKGKNDSVDGDNLRKGLELRRCGTRIKTSYDWSEKDANESRPKTAPTTRTCWVIKSDLPRYNGLRSEYGLSAEQLQERKQLVSLLLSFPLLQLIL